MQIAYQVEEKDYVAFIDYSMAKNPEVKKMKLINRLFIFVLSYWQLFYAFIWGDFLNHFSWSTFIVYLIIGTITFGVVLVFSIAVAHAANRFTRNLHVKKHKYGDGVLGEHMLRLNENHLTEITDVNQTRIAWKGINRVEQTPEYIFVYTSPVTAHIIPKRCFPDLRQADLFFDETVRLREAAKTEFSPSFLAANS